MKGISILFENEHILALNKPAGLPVQGGVGVGASLDALLAKAYQERPLLVHRLDKDTSGVLVTAKDKRSASTLSELFSKSSTGIDGEFKNNIQKTYLALCAGRIDEQGSISETISIKGRSQTALTSYTRLKFANDTVTNVPVSFVELRPATGRMHQIRIHLASIKCPILGDDKYGDFNLNKKLRKSLCLKKMLLHAASLYLPPSVVPGGITINAPLPEYFKELLQKLMPKQAMNASKQLIHIDGAISVQTNVS